MIEILIPIMFVYIAAIIAVKSPTFYSMRERLKGQTPFLRHGGIHLLDCRLCVGFWFSLLAVFIFPRTFGFIATFCIIYGASYFLATQERSL